MVVDKLVPVDDHSCLSSATGDTVRKRRFVELLVDRDQVITECLDEAPARSDDPAGGFDTRTKHSQRYNFVALGDELLRRKLPHFGLCKNSVEKLGHVFFPKKSALHGTMGSSRMIHRASSVS